MIEVQINRLSDHELGNSLVCKIEKISDDVALDAIQQINQKQLLKDIAEAITPNNKMSVRQVIMALGKSDTGKSKKLITDLLPLDQEVITKMDDDSNVKLKRSNGTGHGDIFCFWMK